MIHIPGLLKFCSSRNLTSGKNYGERTGHLEGYSSRQCAIEDTQRCANSRWLTDGYEHNRNLNLSMWPDNVKTTLCYFVFCILIRVYLHLFLSGDLMVVVK